MEGYPVGFRFHPTDDELVSYYLHNRSAMAAHFRPSFFAECPDFYGKTEPWVIWDKYGGPKLEEGEALHLFAKRHKLNPKGKHFDRKMGSGTWSAQYSREVVEDRVVIGVKREFRYEGGSDSDQNNAWLMQEFEISEKDVTVLCTLRKNPKRPPPTTTTTSTQVVQKNKNFKKKTTTAVDDKKRKQETSYVEEQCSTSSASCNSACDDEDDRNKAKRLRIEQAAATTTSIVGMNFSNYSDYDQNADCSWLQMVDYQQSTIANLVDQQSSISSIDDFTHNSSFNDNLGESGLGFSCVDQEDIYSSLPAIIDPNLFRVIDNADSSSQMQSESSSINVDYQANQFEPLGSYSSLLTSPVINDDILCDVAHNDNAAGSSYSQSINSIVSVDCQDWAKQFQEPYSDSIGALEYLSEGVEDHCSLLQSRVIDDLLLL